MKLTVLLICVATFISGIIVISSQDSDAVDLVVDSDYTPPTLTVPPKIPKTADQISMRAHPRIFITQESLPALRQKLNDSVYANELKKIRSSKNPVHLAFRYLVFDDAEAGQKAKRALLTGEIPRLGGLLGGIELVQISVLFDWLYDLLTPGERRIVTGEIMRRADKISAREKKRDEVSYYVNAAWSFRGYETIAALAAFGDHPQAEEIILAAYKGSSLYFSPYHGGAVDVLNTMSLSSGGGGQAGQTHGPVTGYESRFHIGAIMLLKAWESATGESLIDKTNFFEKLPYYLTYAHLHTNSFGEVARQTLEYCTAMNSEHSAGLAAWLLEKEGRAKYAVMFRLIFGDMRHLRPYSPEELKLPTVSYVEGADVVVSRTSWDVDGIALFFYARHWDTSRYEPDSGLLAIYRGGEPLLVRGIVGKSGHKTGNTSGMWIWPRNKPIYRVTGQGSTYWNELNNIPIKSKRAWNAGYVHDNKRPYYQPLTLTRLDASDQGVIATSRYEKLLAYRGVKKAERTIRHNSNIVEIDDSVQAPKSFAVLWSLRLTKEPQISGALATTPDLEIEILSPEVRLEWSGGDGRELIGPTGKWHGSRKGGYKEGYAKDPKKVRQYGLGYLFAHPKVPSENYEFRAKITIK